MKYIVIILSVCCIALFAIALAIIWTNLIDSTDNFHDSDF